MGDTRDNRWPSEKGSLLDSQMNARRKLISELLRRRVFQTMGIYIVGAWAILQVADLAFECWGLPVEVLQDVWFLAFVLFPVALNFGWRYDIIARTPNVATDSPRALTHVDFGVLGAILIVVGLSACQFAVRVTEIPASTSMARLGKHGLQLASTVWIGLWCLLLWAEDSSSQQGSMRNV